MFQEGDVVVGMEETFCVTVMMIYVRDSTITGEEKIIGETVQLYGGSSPLLYLPLAWIQDVIRL